MKLLFILLSILIIVSCNNITNSKKKFANNGITTVLNGRDQIDSLKYTCDSCYEIIKDKSVFDTIITIASKEAKAILKNKLSFKPLSVDISVFRKDSLFFTSGKKIDSLVVVLAKYKCIGKNGYGVEDEVESTSLIYLINNKVTNLVGKIIKDSLFLSGDNVSRDLNLYDDNGTITIQPIKLNGVVHLIVTTDESCVEDARLKIGFSDNTQIIVDSWNKFNCDNTSYFKLSFSNVALLQNKPISFVTFSEDNYIFCSVPENDKDYFIQYTSLINK